MAVDPDSPEGIRQHRFTAPPGATTVLVVRHGESAPEMPDRPFELRDGHGDPELHPEGRRQAELLADRREPDLREVFLGEWEGGLFRRRAVANDPVFQEIFREERWDVIPGAEPLADFDERVWRGFQRIVAAHPDQRVMLVSHGGVIGHLLHQVTGSRRFAFSVADNASISEIVAGPERVVLRRYNDVAHLVE